MSQLKMLALSLATAGSLALLPAIGLSQTDGRVAAQQTGDDATSAAVRSRLLWNHSTSDLDIEVTFDDGVVTLSGPVESAQLRELAERLAADTNGVRAVRNQLQVTAPAAQLAETRGGAPAEATQVRAQQRSESWISGTVRTLMLFTDGLNKADTQVEVQDTQAALTGEAEAAAVKQQSREAGRTVRGARQTSVAALKIDS